MRRALLLSSPVLPFYPGIVLIRVCNSLPGESIDGGSIRIRQHLCQDFSLEERTGPVLLSEVSRCSKYPNA